MPAKKISIEFLFTAGRAIKDAETGKWSFVDLFDNISIPKNLDSLYQSFYVACRLANVPAGQVEVDVEILNPDKTVLTVETVRGELVAGTVTFAVRYFLLNFTQIGVYSLKVSFNNIPIKSSNNYSFRVLKEEDDGR